MKNKKLIAFLILIMLVGVGGIAVGATASYWSEASSVTGVAPQAITYDYNDWKKYVTWQFVDNNQSWILSNGVYVWSGVGSPSNYNVEITGFANYTTAGSFIVPEYINAKIRVSGNESMRDLKVIRVKNTIFADDSLKKYPTSVVIPAGVTIETSAFSGLIHLNELIFDGATTNSTVTNVESLAFSGCTSLRHIKFNQGRNTQNFEIYSSVNFSANAFLGCNGVSDITNSNGAVTYSSSLTPVSSNWSAFLTFTGLPSNLANPY